MKSIISIIFIFLFTCNPVTAQDSKIVVDSSTVELRSFSNGAIKEIKSDDDFDYTVSANPTGASLWQRFVNWLRSIFMPLFSIEWGGYPIGKLLLYIIMIAGLSIAIFRLIKMRSQNLFLGERKSGMEYEVMDENIHAIDFDTLLKEAVDTGQFKRAIRLTYLHALKLLSDADKIHWEPGKTNLDYTHELPDNTLRRSFGELGYFFEYAWYGEFDITRQHYQLAREAFHKFREEGDI
jgi:hypothetical protein